MSGARPLGSTLRVAFTWDGEPLPPHEVLSIDWRIDASLLTVAVDAPLHDDPWPPAPAGRAERLWEYEVAELFLVGPRGQYFELELGPHGHYLALRLAGVRHIVRDDLHVDYVVSRNGARWLGVARLDRTELPQPIERANAFAMHGAGLARRHLAAHPLGGLRPDFHRIADYPEL